MISEHKLTIFLGLVFPEAENRYVSYHLNMNSKRLADFDNARLWAAISTLEGFVVNKGRII